MYRPPSPVSSVKIVQGAPSPIFTEGRLGGGGVCTQARFALLYLKKKITLPLPGEKVYLSSQIQHTFSVFSASEALILISQPANLANVLFPSQVKFCLTKRVFCRSGGGYSCRKFFLKKILLANNLPTYMYTYVVPARGGGPGGGYSLI